jgi:hypothetical protein
MSDTIASARPVSDNDDAASAAPAEGPQQGRTGAVEMKPGSLPMAMTT